MVHKKSPQRKRLEKSRAKPPQEPENEEVRQFDVNPGKTEFRFVSWKHRLAERYGRKIMQSKLVALLQGHKTTGAVAAFIATMWSEALTNTNVDMSGVTVGIDTPEALIATLVGLAFLTTKMALSRWTKNIVQAIKEKS